MTGQNGQSGAENRGHFIVDINTVFPFLGKRYFLIFYLGRHLHPRQQEQLVNQRKMGNWVVAMLLMALVAGFVIGTGQLVGWRLGQETSPPSSAST